MGVGYNNLWGTARGATAKAELKSNISQTQFLQYKAGLGYYEPFLFGTRTRGRLNLLRSVNEEYDSSTKVSTIQESNRFDALIERHLTPKLKLTWTVWSIDSVKEYQTPTNESVFTESDQDIVTLGPLLELDFRDNKYLPTHGTYTSWQLLYSDPNVGSSDPIHFIKTEAAFRFYLPLFSSGIIWAHSTSAGYLENLSDRANGGIPSSQAFFLHGQSKIRGFGGTSDNEHIPNGTQFDDGEIITDKSHYYLYKTEFRFPIPNISLPISLSIFYDVGAVIISDASRVPLFKDPVRQSYGIGIHFNTPVGPVILEYARKIDPRTVEREDRFHFSIGTF